MRHDDDEFVSDQPPHHGMSAGQYLATRFSTLKPPMAKAPNPIKLLRRITRQQWAFFMVAFCAWVRVKHYLYSHAKQLVIIINKHPDMGCV